MGMREKLIEQIQSAVGGCARYWAEVIADSLIENGLVPNGELVPFAYEVDDINFDYNEH